MKSEDWLTMATAPLNPYGQAYGPVVLIWCSADGNPWPAYYSPWHGWESRDCGPAWVIPDQEPPIAPEDAVAWMPIAAPWSVRANRPPEGNEISDDHHWEWCPMVGWIMRDNVGTEWPDATVKESLTADREENGRFSGGCDDDTPTAFVEWFRKNYPGPDTIIFKPDWHAPRIWRAALRSMTDTPVQRLFSALTQDRDELVSILRAILDADERGQGQPWRDAMERARAFIREEDAEQ